MNAPLSDPVFNRDSSPQDLYFLTLISGWNCTVPEKSATTKLENNKAIQDKRFCLKEKEKLCIPEKGSDFVKKSED